MTKDEALQQALEALTDFDYDKRMSAIESIKEALKTKYEPVAWMVWGHDNVPSLTFTKPAEKNT